MAFKIHEITAKSIIGPTKVPSAAVVINPYTGCQFACMYCFASFMGRFVGETHQNWGNYLYVKTNAVDLADKEIHRLLKKQPHPKVAISTVTDPYQGAERKYRLTRGILEVFAKHEYQGRIGILTKSPMVLDDIAILKLLANVEVGLSITTTDDKLSRLLEVSAPLASARIKTLAKLNAEEIPTYAFVGPFLPHMALKPELIDQLFTEIKKAGTNQIKVEYLNLPNYVRPKMNQFLETVDKDIQAVYQDSQSQRYKQLLHSIINSAVARHGLTLKFNDVVDHVNSQELIE